MSRAYRIRVQESLKKVIHAKDKVSTQLEVLEILPPEQMAELLAQELKQRGFQPQGKELVRKGKGITVVVDPATSSVTVQSEGAEKIDLKVEREGRAFDVAGKAGDVKKTLEKGAKQDLEKQAAEKESQLQKKITEKLEGELAGLRQELDQAVNRVTAEALKRKAAQIGHIKEMTEDPEKGSLTIVVEV